MPYEPTIKRNPGQSSIELHFPKEAMKAISKYCLLWRLRHEYHLINPTDADS